MDAREGGRKSGTGLRVQFLIVPEDAVLVEGDAVIGGEVGGDAWALRNEIVHRDDARMFLLDLGYGVGKRVAHAGDDLEQRQVGVSEPLAGEIFAATAGEHVL